MTTVVTIGLSYTVDSNLKALKPEDYAKVREFFDGLDEDQTKASTWQCRDVAGTLDDVKMLADLGLEPLVKRIRGQFAEAHLFEEHVKAATKGEAPPTMQIVNVSIPNAALFAVRSVSYLEDGCTNHLQNLLDSGWRLIAVCPPNDTRRPTYIIGHEEEGRGL